MIHSIIPSFKKNLDDSQHHSFLPSFFVLVHLEVTLCSSRDIEIQELHQTLSFGFLSLFLFFIFLFYFLFLRCLSLTETVRLQSVRLHQEVHRPQLKTVHWPEFYANKKHKGDGCKKEDPDQVNVFIYYGDKDPDQLRVIYLYITETDKETLTVRPEIVIRSRSEILIRSEYYIYVLCRQTGKPCL